MLYYILFWMFNGLYYTLLFGTNLLTGGLAQIAVFCLFQCFEGKGYQTESKRNETFGNVIFRTNVIEMTWSGCQATTRKPRGRGARPPPSWASRCSTDVLLPPIYNHIPWKHHIRSQNPISTAATFCTQEIPSWGIFRNSAGGGINHGGLLHQHHSLFDDV